MNISTNLILILIISSSSAFMSQIESSIFITKRAKCFTQLEAVSIPGLSEITSHNVLLSDNTISNVWNNFQDNHTFLQGLLLTIVIKIVTGEIRKKIEKPILDEAGRRTAQAITPDTNEIKVTDWAKLSGCVAMDVAGDASELIPVLGELTDVAFAPASAGVLQLLFKSPGISAFGFIEEILPFTDVIPTFTLSWILATLFPTTPLAKTLFPKPTKE